MAFPWECKRRKEDATNYFMPTLYASHNTVIRGVRYITFSAFHGEKSSAFHGEKSIFDKVEELIVGDKSLSHFHKEEEEHSVSYGMDKEEE